MKVSFTLEVAFIINLIAISGDCLIENIDCYKVHVCLWCFIVVYALLYQLIVRLKFIVILSSDLNKFIG